MERIIQGAFIVIIATALTACSNLLAPTPAPNPARYTLDSVYPEAQQPQKPITGTLLVTEPTAVPRFQTIQMAYVVKPYEISYFVENEWVEQPSKILQPLLVSSLENTGKFKAVVSQPYAGVTDYRLDTNLLRIQQNFLVTPSVGQLELSARLVDSKTQTVVATKRFTLEESASQQNPYGGVIAINKALKKLMQQLDSFVVTNINANKSKKSQ